MACAGNSNWLNTFAIKIESIPSKLNLTQTHCIEDDKLCLQMHTNLEHLLRQSNDVIDNIQTQQHVIKELIPVHIQNKRAI